MVERTLFIIKPDAVESGFVGKILSEVEEDGFGIIGIKKVWLSKGEAKEFYIEHKERQFYDSLTDFMSSGPCVVVALMRESAITRLRELIGSTDPKEAKEGTIRAKYGRDKEKNAVHASDSEGSAKREIAFFFSERELL